ncbi:sodium:solute symporter [Mycobacterium sp. DL592]|uniref:sodium:solute symporter family protein n=1 Tax=Mycobacterium sp. DL592 TaxID=2675524 RepID=UPI0014202F9D|nr:sodium:solute symporter family protein [Mycobacterium sp. DL592]
MNAAVSVTVLAAFLAATVALGVAARRSVAHTADLTGWSIGGRSLGLLFTLVLMAGESYTSFSYLGAAGWSYTHGLSALYVVAYVSIGMSVSYLVGPILWTYAHRHNLVGISDIVAHRFAAPWLGALTAILATVFVLPYIQLQITGMGVVVTTVSYGTIGLSVAYLVAFVVSEAFILASGLRGSAWVSVLKDILAVSTLSLVFIYIPLHYFGSYREMFARISQAHRDWLTLPGPAGHTLGIGWFVSTVVLNGVVLTVFPTQVTAYLGAKSAQTLRKNAIILPFYQVLLFVPVILGLAALIVVPGLKDSNLALFAMIESVMPAWLLGVIGAAGALSAIVPMAMFMLVIGTMWGRSVLGIHPRTAPRQRELSQAVALLAGIAALAMTYVWPNALVRLSLISYEGMAQLMPAVLLALLWRKISATAILSGLVIGVSLVSWLVFTDRDPFHGINAGLVALAANLAAVAAISAIRPAHTPEDRIAQPERISRAYR